MENIFKQLPIAFPFYESLDNQEIYKENVDENLFYKLYTPQNSLLPFQIRMPVNKPAPTAWKIIQYENPSVEIDITNKLNLIKLFVFGDYKQAVFFGDDLGINMTCGHYYTKLTFPDGTYYVSEVFFASSIVDCMRVEFWQEKDVAPIIYRNNWKQILYLPTFVHTALPEIDEETTKDGFNNEIPVYQKMMLKYKFVDVVPDFLKIALVSLQMQDYVYLWISETRKGFIDRIWVSATPDETGMMNDVEVLFEDDLMIKTKCNNNDTLINLTNW